MSPHLSPDAAGLALPDRVNLQLFCKAQAYLEHRKDRETLPEEERQAWAWFYATYDPVLRCSVRDCGVRQADRDDCLQEAWMEVGKKLSAFVCDGSQGRLCSWLHTIAQSKATDLLRYRARHPTRHLRPEAEAAREGQEAGPVADCERHELHEAVQRVLIVLHQQVPERSYRAFYIHCVDKHTIKQTAAELNLTERQVRRCVHKTKRGFRLVCEQDKVKDFLTGD